jgi:hypothetical protein
VWRVLISCSVQIVQHDSNMDLSAGLAFALQKVVTAIAGYFIILRASELSAEALDQMQRRYALKPSELAPKVYYRLTDNWLELTVRFIVEDHGIRTVKDAMSRQIICELDAAEIVIASATLELVGLPKLRFDELPKLRADDPSRELRNQRGA